jgi:hypothetical protein
MQMTKAKSPQLVRPGPDRPGDLDTASKRTVEGNPVTLRWIPRGNKYAG